MNYEVTKKEKLNPRNEIELLKNSISIIDYAQEVLGLSPVFIGNGRHKLGATGEPYDSCIIFPDNHFHRFSRNVGGDIFEFIQHFEDVDFKQALNRAKEYYNEYSPEKLDLKQYETSKQDIDTANPILPERADDNKRVLAYLIKTRALDKNVVYEYIKRNLLYQEKEHHNAVWVGELDGKAIYTTQRSTQDRKVFRRDSPFKEVGIYFKNNDTTRLIVNEAAIDQMSIMSLIEEPNSYSYLSVGGVSNAINSLRLHLERRAESELLTDIVCAFDNDEAGIKATEEVKEFLSENYPHLRVHEIYPESKDFNQDLKEIRNGEEPYLLSMQESEVEEVVDEEIKKPQQTHHSILFNQETPYATIPINKDMIMTSYFDEAHNRELKVMQFPQGHAHEGFTFLIPAQSFTLTQADQDTLQLNIRKDFDIQLVSKSYSEEQKKYVVDEMRILKGIEIADAYTNPHYTYVNNEVLLFTKPQLDTVKDTLFELVESEGSYQTEPRVVEQLEKRLLWFSSIGKMQEERVSLSRSDYKEFEQAVRNKQYDNALSLIESMTMSESLSLDMDSFELGGELE